MFVQLIQGHVRDGGMVRELFQQWMDDLAPAATGWLGSTVGVTDDGELFVTARFTSEEEARRNSDRPEQDAWWNQLVKHFTDQPVFHDCPDVTLLGPGGSDDAGFVQVLQGDAQDPERLRREALDDWEDLARRRPEVLGATLAFATDGTGTEAVYFTSEAEAHEGERTRMPDDWDQQLRELQEQLAGLRFLDLRDPMPLSPPR